MCFVMSDDVFHHGCLLPDFRGTFIKVCTESLNSVKIGHFASVAYPGILFGGRGGSTNSVEDRGQRERGSGGGSPLVRGSGGSCNLVQ